MTNSVDTIINEMNVLILNKDIILPSNTSSLLDQEYGFKQKGNFFSFIIQYTQTYFNIPFLFC